MRGLRSEAVLVWLIFTLPCFNAAVDDSGNSYCEVGADSLRDLKETRVYFWPRTGGLATRVHTKSAVGKACKQDSVQVDPGPGGHFWITSADSSGNESCSSDRIYLGSTVTSVDLPPAPHPVKTEMFDVTGRRVSHPRVSGIYWTLTTYSDGRKEKRRIVYLK